MLRSLEHPYTIMLHIIYYSMGQSLLGFLRAAGPTKVEKFISNKQGCIIAKMLNLA